MATSQDSPRGSLEEDAKSPIRKVRIVPGKSETSQLAQGCFQDLWRHMGGNVTAEETRRYYDMMACHFDELMAEHHYNGPSIMTNRMISLNIPKEVCILDVGCGTGLLGAALSKAGYATIDGIDMSEEMLRQAQKKSIYGKTMKFIVDHKMKLSDHLERPYDVICLLSSLQPGHVSALALDNLCSVLKSGGHLLWARSTQIPEKQLSGVFKRGEWQKIKTGLAAKGVAELEEKNVEKFQNDKPGIFGIFRKS